MKHLTIQHKGHIIQQRIDVKSHTALIYLRRNNKLDLIKCIAGDINADGTNNAIDKAKQFIDKQMS